MKKDGATTDHLPEDLSIETLLREKEALSQQVKRLIRAEGKLYEYQQELDAQLKEYKELYELNRRLNGILDIEEIFQETVSYVIQHLEYERAVFLRREEENGNYCVCALDGYYQPSEKNLVAELTIEQDAPCLSPLTDGREYLICKAGSEEPLLFGCCAKLLMTEFFLYPLGYRSHPHAAHALLVVGNSLENAGFYRRVDENPGSLLSMGNLVGLVSSLIENRIFFIRMENAREMERRAEAKYRSIFENAAEGVFQRTPEGRYLDANPALAQMLGYASPLELMTEVMDIGQQLYVEPQYHAELMRQIAAHGKVEGFEARMYRKDRSIIWVSLNMRLVPGNAGQELLYEGMAEEITNRKRGEEALRESEQKYRQLSQALEQRVKEAVDELRQKDRIMILQGRQAVMGEMISNIAHQWRQPLNMLALLAQDLLMTNKRGELGDEFIQANIKRTLEIIRQMSKTIDDFRYFYQPDKVKVDFRVLEPLEKALSLLGGSFQMHGIRTEVLQSGDPVVHGYLNEFVQVLLNILINARDALIASEAATPLISIKLSSEGGKTAVSITDNAGGVPEEIKDKIFEPYFTTKGPEQGTGIGLFMCKTIIEKSMGGTLTVRNVGNGAEFRIVV
ncbi:MAG: histidine kinase [Geobacteraceae bacterium GWC2_58_44]|nr:MAG: histidine kinase [Geobacteraceae bacterium GWC2_58_44]HBG07518.1 histidine kinase [Geobacter sp.]